MLACDLPYLDLRTLQHLIARRDPSCSATAYRSTQGGRHAGLPEPLCAIYEPRGAAALVSYSRTGKTCPRKFLIQSDALLLEQPEPRALHNINTPEEYSAAQGNLLARQGRDAMQIKVQYYAILREQAGRSEETVATAARTPRDLYAELQHRHPFSLGIENLRVAINAEFSDWSQPLAEGDAVVFIRPWPAAETEGARRCNPSASPHLASTPRPSACGWLIPRAAVTPRSKAGCAITTKASRCGT